MVATYSYYFKMVPTGFESLVNDNLRIAVNCGKHFLNAVGLGSLVQQVVLLPNRPGLEFVLKTPLSEAHISDLVDSMELFGGHYFTFIPPEA